MPDSRLIFAGDCATSFPRKLGIRRENCKASAELKRQIKSASAWRNGRNVAAHILKPQNVITVQPRDTFRRIGEGELPDAESESQLQLNRELCRDTVAKFDLAATVTRKNGIMCMGIYLGNYESICLTLNSPFVKRHLLYFKIIYFFEIFVEIEINHVELFCDKIWTDSLYRIIHVTGTTHISFSTGIISLKLFFFEFYELNLTIKWK